MKDNDRPGKRDCCLSQEKLCDLVSVRSATILACHSPSGPVMMFLLAYRNVTFFLCLLMVFLRHICFLNTTYCYQPSGTTGSRQRLASNLGATEGFVGVPGFRLCCNKTITDTLSSGAPSCDSSPFLYSHIPTNSLLIMGAKANDEQPHGLNLKSAWDTRQGYSDRAADIIYLSLVGQID
jgi:hypothetical protein